jgi:hypothetical protein
MNTISLAQHAASSLSREDCELIVAAMRALPGNWSVDFETGDGDDDIYARIVGPWTDRTYSAFLVERQGCHIILTDRLTERFSDCVTCHPSVPAAMHRVQHLVLAAPVGQ